MKHIFANWKMYLDYDESNILINGLLQNNFDTEKVNLVIFPSTLALHEVALTVKDTEFSVGTQNVAWVEKGAYTGAVSAQMFAGVGCRYALVGHSERRYIYNETNEDVRKKIEACLNANLTPVVCIGETKEDLEEGKREYRLKKQLMKAFENLELNGGRVMVAYEPVWAIGTGNACNPDDADSIHNLIKLELKQYFDGDVPVLYGGSVNTENVVSYVSREAIDGVLVGGASAKLDSFLSLIRGVESL